MGNRRKLPRANLRKALAKWQKGHLRTVIEGDAHVEEFLAASAKRRQRMHDIVNGGEEAVAQRYQEIREATAAIVEDARRRSADQQALVDRRMYGLEQDLSEVRGESQDAQRSTPQQGSTQPPEPPSHNQFDTGEWVNPQ
jgi:hypothetical protein